MRELADAIPEVDVMLALAPERLGPRMPFFAGQRVARQFENNGTARAPGCDEDEAASDEKLKAVVGPKAMNAVEKDHE